MILGLYTFLLATSSFGIPCALVGTVNQMGGRLAQVFQDANVGASDRAVRDSWDESNFSDPRHHDPGNFMYMVHAFTLIKPALNLPVMRNPEIIFDYPKLSLSVISNEYASVVGETGLIFRVPKENIVIVKAGDAASGSGWTPHQMEWYLKYLESTPLGMTPHEVIAATYGYNEVVARTIKNGRRIELIGVYLLDGGENRFPESREAYQLVNDLAQKNHLPKIWFPARYYFFERPRPEPVQ
ncbi:MAG: hypothetical protein C5B49_11280 [Bdellovibrio sp.]|nr:MAG: hypothetical protein C5B49_11280 [Bdellovibrio sp.]